MTVMFQRPIRLVLLLLMTLTVSFTAKAQEDAFNWTGLYLGANGGYSSSHYDLSSYSGTVTFPILPTEHVNFSVPSFSQSRDGYVGGGQVGYNYQLGHLVLGLEGDFNSVNSGSAGATVIGNHFGIGITFIKSEQSLETNWNASARLRAGYAWRRFLFYGTGGGAFTQLDASVKESVPPDPRFTMEASNDHNLAGWTAGAGVDWAVAKWVTVGVEYRHSGFGRDNYTFAAASLNAPLSTTIGLNEDQITLRVNLLIGGLMGR